MDITLTFSQFGNRTITRQQSKPLTFNLFPFLQRRFEIESPTVCLKHHNESNEVLK